MAKKIYGLKIGESLSTIEEGESLTFRTAGRDREAAIETLRTIANQHGLRVASKDYGMTAIVSRKTAPQP